MTAPIVREFIRKALLELKEHELREVIQALAPLVHCEVQPKRHADASEQGGQSDAPDGN
jgi:hypothetical protein